MTPQELKDSILSLAVQGKITTQLPEDGDARDMLSKLCYDHSIQSDEPPFDIPDNWLWIPIGCLGETTDTDSFCDGPFGSNLKSIHYIDSPEVRIIQLSNIGNNGWRDENVKYTSYKHLEEVIPRCEVFPGNFVIAKMMPAGRTIQVPELGTRITLGSDAMKFVPNKILNKHYLLYAMASQAFLSQVYAEAHGITRVRTTLKGVKSYLLPIPPLAEQKRIVAKIEELLPLIDRYEKAWSRLEDFNKRFPDDMQKSILQMAIQGKLVEQRPEEGTGEELYKQIQSEKKNLAKKGEVYRDKEINSIKDNELPFDIPDSWIWCRLGALTKAITKGSSPAWQGISYTDKEQGILFVTSENVGNNEMLLENKKYIEKQFNKMHPSSILKKGDILTNLVGASIGRTAIFNEDISNANINQAVCIIRLVNKDLNDYILKYFNSYIAISLMLKDTVDTARANLSLTSVTNLLIPLPPLAEQKRIVTKIEDLLPLCERLKKD